MSVGDDHTKIDSSYAKPKTSSSQMPVSPTPSPNLPYAVSSQPEFPAELSQDLDSSRSTERDETKGDRASVELGIESSLKAIRPPSVGDDVLSQGPTGKIVWRHRCRESQTALPPTKVKVPVLGTCPPY